MTEVPSSIPAAEEVKVSSASVFDQDTNADMGLCLLATQEASQAPSASVLDQDTNADMDTSLSETEEASQASSVTGTEEASQASIPVVEEAPSGEMVSLLSLLAAVRLGPVAANALITLVGSMTTGGGIIADLPHLRSELETALENEASGSNQPYVPAPPIYVPAPSSALPGQPTEYHLPRAGAHGPFFAVQRGLSVGVFSGWGAVSPHVTGVPRSIATKHATVSAAVNAMVEAFEAGTVAIHV